MVLYACQEQVDTIIFDNNRCSYLLYDNGYFFAVVQIAVTSAVNRVVVGSSPTVPVRECNSVGRVRKISALAHSPQNFVH